MFYTVQPIKQTSKVKCKKNIDFKRVLMSLNNYFNHSLTKIRL